MLYIGSNAASGIVVVLVIMLVVVFVFLVASMIIIASCKMAEASQKHKLYTFRSVASLPLQKLLVASVCVITSCWRIETATKVKGVTSGSITLPDRHSNANGVLRRLALV